MISKKTEKGQALILIVLAIVGLIALTAAAVDGGMAYSERRQAQNAADSAALDAGLAKIRGGSISAEGLARAASNGFDNNGTSNTVTVNNPPQLGCDSLQGPYFNNMQYVQVIIRNKTDTYFGGVIGINEVNNCVEAIVRAKPPVTGQMYNGNAIVALKPSGCDAINFYGNADAEIYGGGVFSNSKDTCGLRFNGSPKIKVHDGKVFSTVANGFTYGGSPEIVPYPPQTNVGAFTYPPPEGFLPNIVCSGSATKTGNVMSPGNWTGTFPPNGVSIFQPGVYCINGDFRLNGGDNVQGTDVVFVMNSGDVQWNGNADIKLDAPNDGPFKGLLLYVPMSNVAELHLNGSSDSNLAGTILAPASHIDFNGSGDIQSANTQIIGYTVEMGGSSDSHIYYTDSGNYDATEPPILEMTQ